MVAAAALAHYLRLLTMMKRLAIFLLIFTAQLFAAVPASAALYITIVQGLGGDTVFAVKFNDQRRKIVDASMTMTGEDMVKVFIDEEATRENLLAHFSSLAERMNADDRAALYLIGHGSYDGEQYKFNIPGPDITDADLAEFLDSLPGQNHFLVNTSSASGSILENLENDERIIITATRNGNEKNATEFGEFFAEALSSDIADINKNNTVSIQEAFDFAERSVAEFFESEGKLATEHPQIRGEGSSSFSLARLEAIEINTEDPRLNTLLTRRLELDAEIEQLQLRRNEYTNADYIQRLQALILESAQVSEQIDALSEGSD